MPLFNLLKTKRQRSLDAIREKYKLVRERYINQNKIVRDTLKKRFDQELERAKEREKGIRKPVFRRKKRNDKVDLVTPRRIKGELIVAGDICYMTYYPKYAWTKRLPSWDMKPLFLYLGYIKSYNAILGINLHWINPYATPTLLRYVQRNRMNLKRALNWKILKIQNIFKTAELPILPIATKIYKLNRIKSFKRVVTTQLDLVSKDSIKLINAKLNEYPASYRGMPVTQSVIKSWMQKVNSRVMLSMSWAYSKFLKD
jgi:hypothetical protein